MKSLVRNTAAVALAAIGFAFATPATSPAQVGIGINIGPAPACPYGYYGYAPYNCAPYGYYGPEWFNSGIFLGAGPWHHGADFYGHADRHFDPRYGYHGGFPAHEEHFDTHRDFHEFHGNEMMSHRGEFRGGGRGGHR